MDITLDINLDDIIDELDDAIKRQVPYASFLALNQAVYEATQDVKARVFPYFIEGGPVAFTKRGVQYRKAPDKRNLTAVVFIPDEQWKYMMWVIDAGVKRWGQSKHGIGVPIQQNVRFNKYGNIPGRKRKEGLWREILNRGAGRAAVPMAGQLGRKEFIGKSKNGVVGLWERTGGGGRGRPKLKVFFTHEGVGYRPTVPFRKKATQYGYKRFQKAFNKKLQQVLQRESKRLRVT